MRIVFAVFWLAALAASGWAAWLGWRVSRPFDTIRTQGLFGSERVQPRWAVWGPTAVLALSGLALRAQELAAPFVLFFIFFGGGCVWMSGYAALRLLAARDKD